MAMREPSEIEGALDRMATSATACSPTVKFILGFGQYFRGAPLPPGIARGHPKECYANAAALALNDDSLGYAEGYAYNNELQWPFLHAWCIRDGRVVDNILRHPGDFDYLGILIPKMRLIENERETGTYGVLTGELGAKFMADWGKFGPR